MGRWAFGGGIALLAVGLAALFTVQNSARTVPLSLDLWFWAWQLKDEVSAPVLIGSSFGIGFALGAAVVAVRAFKLAGQVRKLEHQLSIKAFGTGGQDAGTW